MVSNKKTIAIIPARGGSKGIEKKNIRMFAGKPLLAHTIEQALTSQAIQRTFVSTDDDEIARIGKSYGAEVIRRPPEISCDAATSESALLHALDHLESIEGGVTLDFVAFLQCTSPLRTAEDIDIAVQQLLAQDADSLLSVTKSHRFLWERSDNEIKSVNYDYRNRPRRQDFGEQLAENGSFYIFKPWVLREHSNRLGGKIALYEMAEWQTFEIDNAEDFKLCEWLYNEYLQKDVFVVNEKKLELIIYDFDGVMTDNRVAVDQNGIETVRVNRSDGLAVSELKKKNIPQMIVSTEKNQVVKKRAEKLGIPVSQSVDNKQEFISKYLHEQDINPENVVYVGNDINDLATMQMVGMPIAPADAHDEIKRIAKFTTNARGGEGVVRDLLDIIN